MAHAAVAQSIRDMESGTHAVLVYDTPANKRDVLFSHLKEGMDTDGLLYACSEEAPQEIRAELEASGIDVDVLEQKGLLSVRNYDEVYIVGGKVRPREIIAAFSELAWSYSRRGLEGVRACAEMSCFFRHGMVDGLLAYESALHRRFSFPGKGICAYSLPEMVNTGSLEALWPILKAHALVIMTGPNGSFALAPERVDRDRIEVTMGTKV